MNHSSDNAEVFILQSDAFFIWAPALVAWAIDFENVGAHMANDQNI